MTDTERLKQLALSTGKKHFVVEELGQGAFSRALLLQDENGNQIVYKYSLDNAYGIRRIKQGIRKLKKAAKRIFFKQKLNVCKPVTFSEDKFANALQEKGRKCNTQIKIPKSINFGDFILEEYGGKVTSPELLASDKGLKFADELGKLLAEIHKGEKYPPKKTGLRDDFSCGIKDALEVYGHLFPDEVYSTLKTATFKLKRLGNSDEYQTSIHGDIRKFNLLYNEKSDQFSLIDWELSRIDNVYLEFTSGYPACQKIPYTFISKMVDSYNKNSEIKINKEKLKCFYTLGIISSYSNDAILKNFTSTEFKEVMQDKIIPKLTELEEAFSSQEPQK